MESSGCKGGWGELDPELTEKSDRTAQDDFWRCFWDIHFYVVLVLVTEEQVASMGAQITTEAVENEVNAITIHTAHPSSDVNLQILNTTSPEHGHVQVCLFICLLVPHPVGPGQSALRSR
jgi:hypothetical protein